MAVSDWTGPLGEMDFDGIDEDIPNAIARLSRNLDPRNYDSSGMGRGSDVVGNEVIPNNRVSALMRNSVSSMSLTHFRKRLVQHHALQFSTNTLIWPKFN